MVNIQDPEAYFVVFGEPNDLKNNNVKSSVVGTYDD